MRDGSVSWRGVWSILDFTGKKSSWFNADNSRSAHSNFLFNGTIPTFYLLAPVRVVPAVSACMTISSWKLLIVFSNDHATEANNNPLGTTFAPVILIPTGKRCRCVWLIMDTDQPAVTLLTSGDMDVPWSSVATLGRSGEPHTGLTSRTSSWRLINLLEHRLP